MSSNDWKETSWGEVSSLEYGKSLKNYKNSNGRIPVFGTNGPIGFTDKPLCSRAGVIVGRKGAYRGIHFSEKPFFVIDTAFYLKPKIEELDIKYAYYQLLTQDINAMDSGSAIPSTSREDFYNLPLVLPPLFIQQRIASILSSLDDKIELNRQTNQTLEAIAQAIFKEWFVDFNFPGATGEMQDSELGEIPKGWRVGKLDDVLTVKGGTTPSTKVAEYWDGEYHWVTPKDLSNLQFPVLLKTERKITKKGVQQISSGILPEGTLLLSSRAPIGYLAISNIPVSINQGFIAINGTELSNIYLLFWLKQNMEKIISRANGSTFLEISKTAFKEIEIIIPSKDLAERFNKVVIPLFEQIKNNEEQTKTLTQLREGLLPKLMKGEINIQNQN